MLKFKPKHYRHYSYYSSCYCGVVELCSHLLNCLMALPNVYVCADNH